MQRFDHLALPWRSIDQVFAADRVRTEQEQRMYMARKEPKAKKKR